MSSNKVVLVLDREVAESLILAKPVSPEAPCECGATQPAHYCPVQEQAKAAIRDSLRAALQQEGQGEERVEYAVLYDARWRGETRTFEVALANPGDLLEAKLRREISEKVEYRFNHRIESKRILVFDLPAVDLDGEEGS